MEEMRKILEASKVNAQTIIKPMEKMILVYKFCITVLIVYGLTISCLFGYYVNKSLNNERLATRAFVTSINKTIESCTHVKRSNVRMD